MLVYSIKFSILLPTGISKKLDRFGIVEIYPTKAGGREWFINMENPTSDGIFNPQSNISRHQDSSWGICNGNDEDFVNILFSKPSNSYFSEFFISIL
jgi:hypothetical protein